MTFDMSLWVYSQWLDPPSHFCGWNPNSWCYFLVEISNFRCLIPNTWPKDLPAGYLQVGEVGDGHQPHGGDMVESWWWPEFHQSSHRSCGQSLQSRWQLGFTGSNREALAIFRRKNAGVRNNRVYRWGWVKLPTKSHYDWGDEHLQAILGFTRAPSLRGGHLFSWWGLLVVWFFLTAEGFTHWHIDSYGFSTHRVGMGWPVGLFFFWNGNEIAGKEEF